MNDSFDDRRPSGGSRWAIAFAVLLLVLGAGALAYNLGVHQGLAESGKLASPQMIAPPTGSVAVPYAVPYYGWHRHWGFGFGGVLLFFIFWSIVARMLFWRGGWYGRYRGGYCGPDAYFDDWHRRAHQRDDSNQRAHERMDGPQGRS